MANILIINITIPFPANYNGNTVRVLPLSQEIAKKHQCYLVAFDEDDGREKGLRNAQVYKDILLLPRETVENKLYRHLFFRTGHLSRVRQPNYFRQSTAAIGRFIEKHNIDLIIVHTLAATEFVEPFKDLPIIVDDIDCRTLSLTRSSAYFSKSNGLAKFRHYREYKRASYQESRLTNYARFVTTVSPVDCEVLQSLNYLNRNKVIEIPNGISQELVGYKFKSDEMLNTIAFWGALDFPPNKSAVHYFYENVFVPYLAETHVIWYIIGRNADAGMLAMAEKHENIKVMGFVDDLFGLVSRIPIMINPMKMGGGLKNKVLEAFALGRLVISNAMGIEAIPAESGRHYIKADDPQEFARQIIYYLENKVASESIGLEAKNFIWKNYSWGGIGNRYEALIRESLYNPDI